MTLTREDIEVKLLRVLPEIAESYEEEVADWHRDGEHPGLHVVFGAVVNPYVVRALQSGRHGPELRRAFSFFEEMATSHDPAVQDVLVATVAERLTDPSIMDVALALAGPSTQRAIRKSQADWAKLEGQA